MMARLVVSRLQSPGPFERPKLRHFYHQDKVEVEGFAEEELSISRANK